MLVNLRIFHLTDEFLWPDHHSTFHARIGNVIDHTLSNERLFKLNQLLVLTQLLLRNDPIVITIHCMLHLVQCNFCGIRFSQSVEGIAGHCVFNVLKLERA